MNVGASERERSCSWYGGGSFRKRGFFFILWEDVASDMIRASVNAAIGIEKLHEYRFYAVIARMKRLLICRFYVVVAKAEESRECRSYAVVARARDLRKYRFCAVVATLTFRR